MRERSPPAAQGRRTLRIGRVVLATLIDAIVPAQVIPYMAMYSRWGNMKNMESRYRRWQRERERKQQEALNVAAQKQKDFTQDLPDANTADFRWLRRTWQGMKVAFELRSHRLFVLNAVL